MFAERTTTIYRNVRGANNHYLIAYLRFEPKLIDRLHELFDRDAIRVVLDEQQIEVFF